MTSSRRRPTLLALLAALLSSVAIYWSWRGPDGRSSPGVYVALGASDAVGVGADAPEQESWPALVHAGLPEGTRLLNLGVSGARLEGVLRQQLAPAIDAQPRWVSIWPGINDMRGGVSRATFASQLDQILGRLRASATPGQPLTLLVLNIPDLRPLPAFAADDHARLDASVREWNASIAELARRHGAILVDLYSSGASLSDHADYISADGFHPSSAGYRLIAELVLEELQKHAASDLQ